MSFALSGSYSLTQSVSSFSSFEEGFSEGLSQATKPSLESRSFSVDARPSTPVPFPFVRCGATFGQSFRKD